MANLSTLVGRARARAARFNRADDGATAVEFAIVALPFFLLVFGILEIALVLLLYTTLENATADAARTIRTCSLQNGGGATATTFTKQICDGLGWLQGNCTGTLKVDVRTLPQFSNASAAPDPYASGSFNQSKVTFTPGDAGNIVLVRAWYPWPLFAPLLNSSLVGEVKNTALVKATEAFVNEPGGC